MKPIRSVHIQQFLKIAISSLALIGFGACASVFNLGSRATQDIALGTVTPGSFESIPDWTMDLVRSCYAESLRLIPDQEGIIVFAVHPPVRTGRVESQILDSSSLDEDLVECIRLSFGAIHHYVGSGRMQHPVSDTLFLNRAISQVCEPPTPRIIESIASKSYREYEVVNLTDIDIVRTEHQVTEHRDDYFLLRYFVAKVELEFKRDGYEGQCFHGYEYKLFSTNPVEAKGAGHVCESIQRRKGERVFDTFTVVFELDQGKWWESYGERAYCGNRRSWLARRY